VKEEIDLPDPTFLESYPLYRRLKVTIPLTLDNIAKPPISMPCAKCNETRTFRMFNNFYDGYGYSNFPSNDQMVKASYACSYCSKFAINLFIQISDKLDWICKSGQYPPWSISGDPNIQSMLGSHQELLTKGLVCESQSYGVGSFAYYRRIVEEIIDKLLDDVSDLLSPDEQSVYAAALSAAKKTRITSEKIELVKELLPAILRPNNMNPLALLHGVLSAGLHAETDEKCLELAVEVREILTFLASQVAASKIASQSFNDRMRALLDKRDKNISLPPDNRPQLI
jgi:hypothetical protein